MSKVAGFTMLGLALISISGCQVMSAKECRTADWYQTGYQDGRSGQPRSRIEDIADDCAKAGVTPDRQRYYSGRERGLLEYCTTQNGFALGQSGVSFNDVCPPASAASFESSWRDGRQLYDARSRVDELERKSRRLEDKLSQAKSDDEKHRIRDELSENDSDLRSARDNLRWVENRLLR